MSAVIMALWLILHYSTPCYARSGLSIAQLVCNSGLDDNFDIDSTNSTYVMLFTVPFLPSNRTEFGDNYPDDDNHGLTPYTGHWFHFPLLLEKLITSFSIEKTPLNPEGFSDQTFTKKSLNNEYLGAVSAWASSDPSLLVAFPFQVSEASKNSDIEVFYARLQGRARMVAFGHLQTRRIWDDSLVEELQKSIYDKMVAEFNALLKQQVPGAIAIQIVLGNFVYNAETHSVYCPNCDVSTGACSNPADTINLGLALKHKLECGFKKITTSRFFDLGQRIKDRVCECGMEKPVAVSDSDGMIHLFALCCKSNRNCIATINTFNPGLWHPHHRCWAIIAGSITSSQSSTLGVFDAIVQRYSANLVLDRILEAQAFNSGLNYVVEYLLETASFAEDPDPLDLTSIDQEDLPSLQTLELSDPESNLFAPHFTEQGAAGSSETSPFSESETRDAAFISWPAPDNSHELVNSHINRLENDSLFWRQVPDGMARELVLIIAASIPSKNSYSIFRADLQETLSQLSQGESAGAEQAENTSELPVMAINEFHFFMQVSGLSETALKELLTELAFLTQGTQESPVPIMSMDDPRVFGEVWEDLLSKYQASLGKNIKK